MRGSITGSSRSANLAAVLLIMFGLTGLGSVRAFPYPVAPGSQRNLLHLEIDDPEGWLAGLTLSGEVEGQPDWIAAARVAVSIGPPVEWIVGFDVAAAAPVGSQGMLRVRVGGLDSRGNWALARERRVPLVVAKDVPRTQRSYDIEECCLPPSGLDDRLPRPPAECVLLGGVPNPSQSLVSIRFGLPAGGGTATLEVYDVTGRSVRTMITPPLEAGYHQITWNGADGRGRRVPPGVYFYRLTARDWSATRQILLLR